MVMAALYFIANIVISGYFNRKAATAESALAVAKGIQTNGLIA